MKHLILAFFLFCTMALLAQEREKDRDYPPGAPRKELGLNDRAGGTHNAGNIGLFFENRGKLYPRRITQGPSGEWPINSGKHYIYRINPFVGVAANPALGIETNVIQGRFTTNEEWEAAPGYNNNQGAKVAFSDDPSSWPVTGWPVKDAQGNPVILSDQDSYCVYTDSVNSRKILNISVAQTGYQYGVKFAQNILFFKFDVINRGPFDLSGVYFALYSDIDMGNVSGGTPEYGDDKIGFDKENNYLFFYDSKGYSTEWPDRTTGYFGIAFLKTPKINGVEAGITDMHYFLYDKERDLDTVQYGIMSSAPSLYNSTLGPDFFHVGSQPTLHYDDTSTIPAGGLDICAMPSSGPYFLKKGDTLTFYTAIVAGVTQAEAIANVVQAKKILLNGFELSKPPVTPKLSAVPGDKKATLFWDDAAERSKDGYSGQLDFEGYKVYRSIDRGVSWKQIAEFDKPNGIGVDRGIQYSYTDTTVNNGFEYWYSATAYDRGDSAIAPLESPLGKTIGAVNLAVVSPAPAAIGYQPVSAGAASQVGTGKSNYTFTINPVDNNSLANNLYTAGFMFTPQNEKGQLRTRVTITVLDSNATKPERYGIAFKAPNKFDLVNLTTGDNIREDLSYIYTNPNQTATITGTGLRVRIEDSLTTPAEFRPKAGDLISINFSTYVLRNGADTVIAPRTLLLGKNQATSDGVIFTVTKPNPIKNVSRVGGRDNLNITFTVSAEASLKNKTYLIATTGGGIGAGGNRYVSLTIDTANGNTAQPLIRIDTLYGQGSFTLNGITGTLTIGGTTVPGAGNIFSVETIIPVAINIKDKFRFGINPATVNKSTISARLHTVKVVPNPYMVSSLYEQEFGELRREPVRQLKFINLPPECSIYIFAVDGILVKTIQHSSFSGSETWDLRAEGGREIAPGVYLYVVESPEGTFKDRFAVIK